MDWREGRCCFRRESLLSHAHAEEDVSKRARALQLEAHDGSRTLTLTSLSLLDAITAPHDTWARDRRFVERARYSSYNAGMAHHRAGESRVKPVVGD